MDKYIEFDINSKKAVACVVQKGKTDSTALRIAQALFLFEKSF